MRLDLGTACSNCSQEALASVLPFPTGHVILFMKECMKGCTRKSCRESLFL